MGTRPGPGPGMMGLYIMPLTVHPTLRQRQGEVTGPGVKAIAHLLPRFPVPVPVPLPFPVPCSVYESKLLFVTSVTGEGAKLLVHEHKIEYTFRGRHCSLNFNVTLCMNLLICISFSLNRAIWTIRIICEH